MSKLRFMVFGLLALSVLFLSTYSVAASSNQAAKAEKNSETMESHPHSHKPGEGAEHFDQAAAAKESAEKGETMESHPHSHKPGEGAEHFDEGEAAKESAEKGETMESHPHSHKPGEGAEHYEPNK